MSMREKKYTIDDEPASALDIIKKAKELDYRYGRDGFCLTSEAAQVLRDNGYVVGDYKPALTGGEEE